MLDKQWIKKLDIQSPNLKVFLNKCLRKIPVEFKKASASSSNKYHPFFSRFEGGLLHGHTRYAIMFVNHFAKLFKLTQYERDQVIIAMLLHDSFKSVGKDGKWGRYTTKDHALVAFNVFSEIELADGSMMDGTVLSGKEAKKNILEAIRYHMSQWSSPKTEIPVAMEKQWTSKYVLIVQAADYLSAQQDIPDFILSHREDSQVIEKASGAVACKKELFES